MCGVGVLCSGMALSTCQHSTWVNASFTSAATSLDTQKRNSTVCKVFQFSWKTPHKYIVMYYYHYIEQRPNLSCQRASEILNLFSCIKKEMCSICFHLCYDQLIKFVFCRDRKSKSLCLSRPFLSQPLCLPPFPVLFLGPALTVPQK